MGEGQSSQGKAETAQYVITAAGRKLAYIIHAGYSWCNRPRPWTGRETGDLLAGLMVSLWMPKVGGRQQSEILLPLVL